MHLHCLYQEWATLTSLPLIFLWLSTMGMAEIPWEESAPGEKVLGSNFGACLYVRSYGQGKKMNWQRRQMEELVKQEENQESPFHKSEGMNMFQGECPLWGSVLLKDCMR